MDFAVAYRRERWKAFERGLKNAGIDLHNYSGGPAFMRIDDLRIPFRFFPEYVHVKFDVDNQWQFDAVAEIAPAIEAEGITVIVNKQFLSPKEKGESVVSQADVAAPEEVLPMTAPEPVFKRGACECGHCVWSAQWHWGISGTCDGMGYGGYCEECGSLLGPGGWAMLAGRDPKEVQWPEEGATNA
jgi:hypothetical protein